MARHDYEVNLKAEIEIAALLAKTDVGKPISEFFPHLRGFCDRVVEDASDTVWSLGGTALYYKRSNDLTALVFQLSLNAKF